MRQGETALGSMITSKDTDCPHLTFREKERRKHKGLNQMERKYGRRLKVVVITNVKFQKKVPHMRYKMT